MSNWVSVRLPGVGRFQQEGRKPNRKSETEPESPKTEPVAVYKETGETGNRRNRNRGLQKVGPKLIYFFFVERQRTAPRARVDIQTGV